jgi:hypothetical protein
MSVPSDSYESLRVVKGVADVLGQLLERFERQKGQLHRLAIGDAGEGPPPRARWRR